MKRWTPEEDSLLEKLYYHTPREELITKFNRSWKAIKCRASLLNLKRDKELTKKENIDKTREVLLNKYGTTNIFSLPEIKEKIKQTHLEKRGVPYPTQSQEVKEKIKKTVKEKYGVDNVFKAKQIKEKIKATLLEKYKVNNPLKSTIIKEKVRNTTMKKYNTSNIFHLTNKIRNAFYTKYNYLYPLQVPEIKKKKEETCIKKYGTQHPSQLPIIKEKLKKIHLQNSVKEKKYTSFIKNKNISKSSKEELKFLNYLLTIDPSIISQPIHPTIKHVFDFYSPLYDLWIQYDGIYWHGKNKKSTNTPQNKSIQKIIEKDKLENKLVPNLIRFWSDEVETAIKNHKIIDLIKSKIKEKIKTLPQINTCYQYIKKIEHYKTDILNLPFNHTNLKASDFTLNKEDFSKEIKNFIEKYEWLGTVGNPPKWCFTARYKNTLGGVILINEPIKYSKILGENTPKYEALIQRGATASWTPKNLGSKLLMFACNWMVKNTEKRAFVGYIDPSAGEKGIIYQACNFDYLGDNFGASYTYYHPEIEGPFTEQSLKRTSAFKKWCKNNKIEIKENWIKPNGIKDLKKIPTDIKNKWYTWIKDIIANSKKIKINKKRKYALILPKNKKEKKLLYTLKTYTPLPYPKDNHTKEQTENNTFSTISRINEKKLNFIIDNYNSKTIKEISEHLNESERWVKRQIQKLLKNNRIKPKTNP